MNKKLPTGKNPYVWCAFAAPVVALATASFSLDLRLWGLNWYGYFGEGALVALMSAALIGALFIGRVRILSDAPSGSSGRGPDRVFPIIAAAVILAFGVAFYLLRARTHFLGDGYQLLAALVSGVNHKPWEIGTFQIQESVYALLGGQGEEAAERALQLVSCVAGILFALVTAFVSARLFSATATRLLYILGVITGGYALLFFGYFESYPLFVLAVGALFQSGLLIARDKLFKWWIMPLLAIAAFCHIFAVALIPGALYLLLRGTRLSARLGAMTNRVKVAFAAAGLLFGAAAFVHFYYHSYFFRFTIVPLISDRHSVEGYTLFSATHLLDYLNHFFQLFPGIAVALAALWPVMMGRPWRRPTGVFTLLTLLPSMGLVFIFNPGLGFPRDWDLFAFAGVPLVCGLLFLLLDEEERLPFGRQSAALSMLLSLLVLSPRVATQVIPEKGIAVFDRAAQLDRVKNSSGRFLVRQYLSARGQDDEAERRRVEDNVVLPEGEWIDTARRRMNAGDVDGGIELLRRAAVSDPTNYSAWTNLGIAYGYKKVYDSAALFLEIADARMPYNAVLKRNLGGINYARGDYIAAKRLWLEAADIEPANEDSKTRLLLLYENQGREDDLQTLLGASPTGAAPALLLRAAELGLQLDEDAVAAALARRALRVGADTATVCELQRRYPRLRLIDCR